MTFARFEQILTVRKTYLCRKILSLKDRYRLVYNSFLYDWDKKRYGIRHEYREPNNRILQRTYMEKINDLARMRHDSF